MEAPIPVVITRSTWLRGDRRRSKLYNPELGKMCCVGFMCLAKGITKGEMIYVGGIGNLEDRRGMIPGNFFALYAINDTRSWDFLAPSNLSLGLEDLLSTPITDAIREETIIRLALPLGFAVTFED